MTRYLAIGDAAQASLGNNHTVTAIGRYIEPEPFIESDKGQMQWVIPFVSLLSISLLILIAVAWQLRQFDYHSLSLLIPSAPLFWVVFLVYYLVGPASDWIIFRRLWALPLSDFHVLVRKLISNEIFFSYLGEIYFYNWARHKARISAEPFGAIRDVTILSALTGNLFALLMLFLSVPFARSLHLGIDSIALVASTFIILSSSAAMLVLRQRLFTLPRRELWFVAGVHAARIVVSALLAAFMWHLLLPSVAPSSWLILSTARQLLSRLPFLPNKDVVFAGLAIVLAGPNQQIVAAIALMAMFILTTHLVVGSAFGLSALLNGKGLHWLRPAPSRA